MSTLFIILIIIVCFLLIIAVLLQNSKGGGLAANFSSAQIMGVRRTADVLEKATWILAGSLIFLAVVSTTFFTTASQEEEKKSVIEEQMNETPSLPSVPGTIPAPPAQDSSK